MVGVSSWRFLLQKKINIIFWIKFTNHQQIFISSGSKWIIGGALTGSVVFILICIFTFWFCWRRRKRRKYANLLIHPKSSSIYLIFMGKKIEKGKKSWIYFSLFIQQSKIESKFSDAPIPRVQELFNFLR